MIQHEGPGWRLAKDSSREKFPVIIGGDGWALELTEQEWISLIALINELITQHKGLENQLMQEESISLEIERQPWWGCLDGDRDSWSLHLVFESQASSERGFEAFWPKPAAQSIAYAMRNMWDCCQ